MVKNDDDQGIDRVGPKWWPDWVIALVVSIPFFAVILLQVICQ